MSCDALCLPCFALGTLLARQQEASEDGGGGPPDSISHEHMKKGMSQQTVLVMSV